MSESTYFIYLFLFLSSVWVLFAAANTLIDKTDVLATLLGISIQQVLTPQYIQGETQKYNILIRGQLYRATYEKLHTDYHLMMTFREFYIYDFNGNELSGIQKDIVEDLIRLDIERRARAANTLKQARYAQQRKDKLLAELQTEVDAATAK